MDDRKYTLSEMRNISQLSIKCIVEKSGISYKSIRNWETGQNVPSLINVNELLKVYGFSFEELDMSAFYNKNRQIN